MTNVLWFDDIDSEDAGKVGGTNADLGEIHNSLDVPVLSGFVTTSIGFNRFMRETGLEEKIENLLDGMDPKDTNDLHRRGEKIRAHINEAEMPENLKKDILSAYNQLVEESKDQNSVSLSTSIIAEDTSDKFQTGHIRDKNVSNEKELIDSIKNCFASLFENSAISHRAQKEISHSDIGISVRVNREIKGEKTVSGNMFTLDHDSGFEDVVSIKASYGLADHVIEGHVDPDEFILFKKNHSIIEKKLGEKQTKSVVSGKEKVPISDRDSYCMTDNRLKELSRYGSRIEELHEQPMEIEWVFDSSEKKIYITSVRPEAIHSDREENFIESYRLNQKSDVLAEGDSVGSKIYSGEAYVLTSPNQIDRLDEGGIVIVDTTDPDWEPVMEKAGAIVTNKGERTGHTAIISRELGIPVVIGSENATSKIKNGQDITVDCTGSKGKIWDGCLEFSIDHHEIDEIPSTETDIMVNISEPDEAFRLSKLPVDGVGLMRQEHIISSEIEEHPLKLIDEGREDEYIEALRSNIGKVGAAFYPKEVIIRLTDFRSDEYLELEGGQKYEPEEENPMLGFRGASRFHDSLFSKVFELECKALRRSIDEIGLDNISVMVPFCRTVDEAKNVRAKMKEYGLDQNDIDIHLKAELPSNVILAEEFGRVFDGFSIGTTDLTQLTLGIDSSSQKLSNVFDEGDPAVKESLRHLIRRAPEDTEVGICGDAASTYDGYIEFLVEHDIDSISVSPDVALETVLKVAEVENEPDTEDYEFSLEAMVGTPAGKIYDALEKHGSTTADKLINYMPSTIDSRSMNQALGWLAKEEKLEVKNHDGEVVYSLSDSS